MVGLRCIGLGAGPLLGLEKEETGAFGGGCRKNRRRLRVGTTRKPVSSDDLRETAAGRYPPVLSGSNGLDARVNLAPSPDGRATVLPVRAQPHARRTGASGTWNGMLKISVASPPEDGRANAEIARTIAALFGVRASDVRLIHGDRSRTKRFLVPLAPALCAEKLARILEAAP